jgi:xylan 1,4-beta-xylosidase
MLSSPQSQLVFLFLAAAAAPGLSCGSGGTAGNTATAGQPSASASAPDGSSPPMAADDGPGDGTDVASSDAGAAGSGGPSADGSTDSTGGATGPRKTFANPINIEYYFQTASPSRKETADPAVALYKGIYYLFASQGHGYWYSSDLLSWTHVNPDWPTSVFQEWAPAAWTLNGVLYFATPTVIYSTVDPMGGHWKFEANNFQNLGDPDYFADDDGKLYAYYGLSNTQPPHGVQIDPTTFKPIGNEVGFFVLDPTKHGWENPGDSNDEYSTQGWLEGAWMSKYNGTYYLQYACPGTEFASYSDGVYTSKSPLGPFTYAPNNPFSTRLTGFAHSAGHSATFQDTFGNWWHIGNTLIGDKDKFERRLSLYPAGFDADGLLFVNTGLGDFPIAIPSGPSDPLTHLPEWMLLSYKKSALASSTLAPTGGYTFDAANAFDENIKTVWSAATGNSGEWLRIDLGAPVTISAIQSNFAEQGSTFISPQGIATATFSRRYIVETSDDGTHWNLAIDQSNSTRDLAHDYVQLPSSVTARYVRITNKGSVPGGGQFSVRDLRIFGTGSQGGAAAPTGVTVSRSRTDTRSAMVSWNASSNAIGYLVRYGVAADKLYDSRQVYDVTSCQLNSLDVGTDYYFTVDAISDTAVARGTTTVKAPAQP